MFRTVRHWWSEGSGRSTARLFAFEFLVVVAGVLTAQALQGWAVERNDRASGKALLATAHDNVRSLDGTVRFWARFGPCLRDHVRRIAKVASTEASLTAEQIGRPGLPNVPLTSWTEEGRQRAGLATSESALGDLMSLNAMAQNVAEAEREIGREWAALRLIDSSFGRPLQSDRSRVREAAAAIDNRIGFLLYTRSQFERLAGEAGVKLDQSRPSSAERVVNQCGLLKDWK